MPAYDTNLYQLLDESKPTSTTFKTQIHCIQYGLFKFKLFQDTISITNLHLNASKS